MNRRALRAAARREWGPLFTTVRTALVTRKWRAVPLTLGAVALTACFQIVQNQSWGLRPVHDIGFVRAMDPLWLALLRTPLSLFVPALDLPVWGALVQILLVFGIAEICIGWWRTLLISYVTTLAGTLYARAAIAFGPDNSFGVKASDALIVDTGPSAAVVGLAVFVCWRLGARWTAGAVIVGMVLELVVKDNLAGKEHLAAILATLVLCALAAWRDRRRQRGGPPSRPGSLVRAGSGAPPMNSSSRRRGPAQRLS
ncbi:hypothetical protein ACIPW9_03665 [Streptomyces sp. NPDC090052]|uniref:hypothetical protein n=1 Tax=unclassified Streptomyces TaxID=2593676 RepID=UPI00224F68B0|nr:MULTISPECIES: hypothetical protein [unclassified Streptomyces]MCX4727047.1 hypothetical protein [Streptomyces sp. NBC_01306]WSV03689.1 hypothetical protein OG372_08850 [Streptomyces sp. NBC_01020]WSX41736.1 hypothetical protein OG760_08445 [Streptomyces sp. NBC_00963]WSX70307.1 hypothetical protein OG221_28965 [Streptomyces sp. NBC_00932]